MDKKWWEYLTEDEVEVVSKEVPNYKEYDRPTIYIRAVLDFYYLEQIQKNKEN